MHSSSLESQQQIFSLDSTLTTGIMANLNQVNVQGVPKTVHALNTLFLKMCMHFLALSVYPCLVSALMVPSVAKSLQLQCDSTWNITLIGDQCHVRIISCSLRREQSLYSELIHYVLLLDQRYSWVESPLKYSTCDWEHAELWFYCQRRRRRRKRGGGGERRRRVFYMVKCHLFPQQFQWKCHKHIFFLSMV